MKQQQSAQAILAQLKARQAQQSAQSGNLNITAWPPNSNPFHIPGPSVFPAVMPSKLYAWEPDTEFPAHLFDPSNRLVPAIRCDYQSAFMFHVNTWITVCKPKTQDYGIVFGGGEVSEYKEAVLLIRESETLNQFNVWWETYTARFGDDRWKRMQLPSMIAGEHVNGYPIAHNSRTLGESNGEPIASDELYRQWLWIVNNTNDRIWFMDNYWMFADQGEMLMFRLTENGEEGNDESIF